MNNPHYITVSSLLPFYPCEGGWANFIRTFNDPGSDHPISIVELLDAGIPTPDVIWALRGLPESSFPQVRDFALKCAESVLPVFEGLYPDDKRPRQAIEMAKAYLLGKAALSELKSYADAAYASAYTANATYASAATAAAAATAATGAAAAAKATAAYTAKAATGAAYASDATGASYASYASDAERQKQAEYLRQVFS